MLDELGGPKTYNHYPNGWAMAFNTPFKMWKRYEFNGGTSRPVHHLLAGGHRRPAARSATSTTTRSTSCRRSSTCSASSAPETIKGHVQSRFDGVSMRYSFDDAERRRGQRKTQFYSMLGSRAIWHDGWKAVTTHPTISGWSHFNDDEWELYHTDVDRSELHNLAAEQPGQGPRAGQPLVRRGRRQRRLPARRPLGAGDPHHAAAAAHAAARPLRLLPRTPPRCPSRRRSTSATARSRSARWSTSPRPGAAGRAVRARARASAATPSTSRTTGCTTSTTSSACVEQKVVGDRGPARPART